MSDVKVELERTAEKDNVGVDVVIMDEEQEEEQEQAEAPAAASPLSPPPVVVPPPPPGVTTTATSSFMVSNVMRVGRELNRPVPRVRGTGGGGGGGGGKLLQQQQQGGKLLESNGNRTNNQHHQHQAKDRHAAHKHPRKKKHVTVDTSKAKTSLEALKLSIKQLKWKEVCAETKADLVNVAHNVDTWLNPWYKLTYNHIYFSMHLGNDITCSDTIMNCWSELLGHLYMMPILISIICQILYCK